MVAVVMVVIIVVSIKDSKGIGNSKGNRMQQ